MIMEQQLHCAWCGGFLSKEPDGWEVEHCDYYDGGALVGAWWTCPGCGEVHTESFRVDCLPYMEIMHNDDCYVL